MDNYDITYLINSINLLIPGLFVKISTSESVKIGSSALLIIRRGIYIIKKTLNNKSGPNSADLTLYNIVVVEGFYINIISEARLLESGV